MNVAVETQKAERVVIEPLRVETETGALRGTPYDERLSVEATICVVSAGYAGETRSTPAGDVLTLRERRPSLRLRVDCAAGAALRERFREGFRYLDLRSRSHCGLFVIYNWQSDCDGLCEFDLRPVE